MRGPLGKLDHPRGTPENLRCWQWARSLLASGVRLIIPEIADYEVRRELHRIGAKTGIARLDRLKVDFEYMPLTTDIMLQAAELWADVRRRGMPTASPDALDGDVILAAQAMAAAGPGDIVTVATANVAHLGRFIDARNWDQIVP